MSETDTGSSFCDLLLSQGKLKREEQDRAIESQTLSYID
jgi:hypothetical protein